MSKKKTKPTANNEAPPKVHVYLLVPPVLHEWLQARANNGGFKNVQDKIIDVLRTARESESESQAA